MPNGNQLYDTIQIYLKPLKNDIAALQAIVKGYKIAMEKSGLDVSVIKEGIIKSEAVLALNGEQREIVADLLR